MCKLNAKRLYVSFSLLATFGWALVEGFQWLITPTPEQIWKAASRNTPDYCGKLGRYTYKIPKIYLDVPASYEGDTPWDGIPDWTIKGCNDRLMGFLLMVPLDTLSIGAGNGPWHSDTSLRVLVRARYRKDFLQWQTNYYRQYKIWPRTGELYDEKLKMTYFESYKFSLDRIFWANHPQLGYVMGECSIDAYKPNCALYFNSQRLDAVVKITMAMRHFPNCIRFAKKIETELTRFQIDKE